MKFSMTSQEKLTFKYRWLLNRGDHMGRYQCITTPLTHVCHLKSINKHFKLNRVMSSIIFKNKNKLLIRFILPLKKSLTSFPKFSNEPNTLFSVFSTSDNAFPINVSRLLNPSPSPRNPPYNSQDIAI